MNRHQQIPHCLYDCYNCTLYTACTLVMVIYCSVPCSDFEGAFGGKQRQREWEENETEDERLENIDPKMVELIRNEIMDNRNTLTWDDIAGLEFAKSMIQVTYCWLHNLCMKH